MKKILLFFSFLLIISLSLSPVQGFSSLSFVSKITKDDAFVGVRFHTIAFLLFDKEVFTNLSGSTSVALLHNGTEERYTNDNWSMSLCHIRKNHSLPFLMHTTVDVSYPPEEYKVVYIFLSLDCYSDDKYVRHIERNFTNDDRSFLGFSYHLSIF